MSTCDNCGGAVGTAKFCRACGAPTILGRRAMIDQTRFQNLGDAVIQSYATKPVKKPRRVSPILPKQLPWPLLIAFLVVALIVVGLLSTRAWVARSPHPRSSSHPSPRPSHRHTSSAKAPIALAMTTTAPSVKASPTAPPPTPAPTAPPNATPTAAAPAATPIPLPTPVAFNAANAPYIVRSSGDLQVGGVGSCESNDVTIALSDYPRGCTIFRGALSGSLAGGLGSALIVPVSRSNSLDDIDYALLYVESNGSKWPRFIGILPGDGSGRLTVRLENGLIVEQNGTHTKYSRFDGRRVLWVSG